MHKKVKLYWEGEKRTSATSRKNAERYVACHRAHWLNDSAIQFYRDQPVHGTIVLSTLGHTPTFVAVAQRGPSGPLVRDPGLHFPYDPYRAKVTPHPGGLRRLSSGPRVRAA